jgi:hypothetical protein
MPSLNCCPSRSQNLIAPFCLLLMLLIVVQPKRRVNTDKNEDQFRCPATNT